MTHLDLMKELVSNMEAGELHVMATELSRLAIESHGIIYHTGDHGGIPRWNIIEESVPIAVAEALSKWS